MTDPFIGRRLDQYRIESILGSGAMGTVFLATDTTLNRFVALKVLAPHLSGNQAFRKRFLSESQLMARLEHPNIVTVHGAGQDGEILYIAMQYVRGHDLRRLLMTDPRPNVLRVAHMAEQLGRALAHAHRAGLVHRDIKPANILVADSDSSPLDHWYLADFGITKRAEDATALTATGEMIGTLRYMAPEQFRDVADARSDIYALGAVVLECLAGSALFVHESTAAIMYAKIHDPPPQLADLRPDLPDSMNVVLARALATDPDHRYRSADEFGAALLAAAIGADETTLAAPSPGTSAAAQRSPTEESPSRTSDRDRVHRKPEQLKGRQERRPRSHLLKRVLPISLSVVLGVISVRALMLDNGALASRSTVSETFQEVVHDYTVKTRWQMAGDDTLIADVTISTPKEITCFTMSYYAETFPDSMIPDVSTIAFEGRSPDAIGPGHAVFELEPSDSTQISYRYRARLRPNASRLGRAILRSWYQERKALSAMLVKRLRFAGDKQFDDGDPSRDWQLVAGSDSTCLITSDDDVWCWGSNARGKLATGDRNSSSSPVHSHIIRPRSRWMSPSAHGPSTRGGARAAVALGAAHGCLVTDEGHIQCWGANDRGQSGQPRADDVLSPARVYGIPSAGAVAAGAKHTCALLHDRTVTCFGANDFGQLGAEAVAATGQRVPGPTQVVEISSRADHACALTLPGEIWCWGRNDAGQSGGPVRKTSPPQRVAGIDDAVAVSVGASHSCALLSAGTVTCWGSNADGQLGQARTDQNALAGQVAGLADMVVISAGANHTCGASSAEGSLRIVCWGSNERGQLGESPLPSDSVVPGPSSDSLPTRSPVEVHLNSDFGEVQSLDAGDDHTCAAFKTTVVCWGADDTGQLGRGEINSAGGPSPITNSEGKLFGQRQLTPYSC